MTNSKNTRKNRATVTAEAIAARKAQASNPAAGAKAKATSKAPTKPAPKSVGGSSSAAATSSAKPKPKLVRDSFTIPKSEYVVLEGLKDRAANLTRPIKKSELLRAGVAVLNAMTDNAFLAALNGVPSLKTGRPKG
jgi:cell division septation protein DedD